MNTLSLTVTGLISQSITLNIFMDGGPLFMTLILICLLASLFFLAKGFSSVKKNNSAAQKMLSLTVDSSLLGLVMGFLGSVLGLISAFDSIEALGNPDPSIFAGGLKTSLLTATFGLFSFVVARIGILVLRSILKTNEA
ncbi:MotA/TolQ/ExbB proton channel family protein [Formosa sp. Hel1_31_208]|uniref:MotA/TolQ/ExbB proton channel family protein n=1 Tax=Formosa sp. Hel1_31_208 TaxID=1798225 RepID=UPI00087B30D2|nr:MotA/TolQ/ExbB proton channel family protein [Formosa sp. Hel1_31_208]SDS50927.1 MotA/TolQ/ExbB proton channel family protein [Formosa sp. Hel1_31_208]